MTRFWKLWGSIAGMVAGLIVAGLVTAGVGQCTDVAQITTCTVFGLTVAQITSGLTMIGGAIGTVIAPANS